MFLKKQISAILAICLCVLTYFALPVCASGTLSIRANAEGRVNLTVGDSKPLVLVSSDGTVPDVTWSSSDEKRVTVDENGIVTGHKTGSATITATADDGRTASVTVQVRSAYQYIVEWSGTYTSPGNNSTADAALTDAEKTEKAWSTPVGNNTVVILDEYVYTYNGLNVSGTASGNGILYKIEKDTGEIADSITCGIRTEEYYSYIIYGGGLLYVSCPTAVMAFDPDSFTHLWTTEVEQHNYCPIQFVGDCVVTNGTVLNSTTGKLVRKLEGSYSWANGAEADGYYYVAGADGKLYAFDTSDWKNTDTLSFGGQGAGVLYSGGRLYWGDQQNGMLYTTTVSDGKFGSLKQNNCGYSTYTTPVAAGNRVYLAGSKLSGSAIGTGVSAVCVFNAQTLELEYQALLVGSSQKIQTTPVLMAKYSGGNVVAGGGDVSVLSSGAAVLEAVYVYFQDYQNPCAVYYLKDTLTQNGFSMEKLVQIEPAQYGWEQIAFDKEGALYCSNDAGYLVKYALAEAQRPVIEADLSTEKVSIPKNGKAETLTVRASVSDGGELSYVWEYHTRDAVWIRISGADTASYTPAADTVGTFYYRCTVKNTRSGSTAQSVSKIACIEVYDERIPGDADNSGEVTDDDLTVLRRYFAGMTVSISESNADVNGDKIVNVLDLIMLNRYLDNWGIELQDEQKNNEHQ